jgi:hypothetical protein
LRRLQSIVERCMQSEPKVDREGNRTGEYTFNAGSAKGGVPWGLSGTFRTTLRRHHVPLCDLCRTEAGYKIGQALALDQDVLPQALLRLCRVPDENCLNDLLVLGKRVGDALPRAQL